MKKIVLALLFIVAIFSVSLFAQTNTVNVVSDLTTIDRRESEQCY